jgi:branched-chain amino acid transport system ATP-binding protein/neutral amino acid transport system ATP-binding protein
VSADVVLLEASGLVAGYVPEVNILTGIDLKLERGEIVTVVGPNGAGKSTLLKVMFGLLRPRQGSVRLKGERIDALQPHQVARRGMGYVPQLDNVFPSMTVEENLDIPARRLGRAEQRRRVDSLYELFPQLRPARRRLAGLLSGGQRQMVAMARALVPEPELLLLDEPSAGLAPEYVELVFQKIVEIRKSGVTILIVEQNARRALALSDRGYVLELGHNRFEGPGPELLKNETVIELYLGRQKTGGDS